MLCKTKSSEKTVATLNNAQVNNSGYDFYTATLTSDTDFRIVCTLKTTNASNPATVRIYKNGTSTNDLYFTTQSTTGEEFNKSYSFKAGDTIKMQLKGRDMYTYATMSGVVYSSQTYKSNVISITPNSIELIGKLATGFIYGMYNGTYKGGIMIGTDTGATTGSITLGNAVGYIKVNFNGEIIKIPYYND